MTQQILSILNETPVVMYGNRFIEAECLILSAGDKNPRKEIISMPKDDWLDVKKKSTSIT